MTSDDKRVHRRKITAEELRRDVDRVLHEEQMDFDRFAELGPRDELTNPRLRDLWLLAGEILIGV